MSDESTFHIVNLGCKVNAAESDALSDLMLDMGLFEGSRECADVIVVNTCTVTAEADKKTRKAIRGALASNENAKVVVTGCAQEVEGNDLKQMDPRITLASKAEVAGTLRSILSSGGGSVQVAPSVERASRTRLRRARPLLKVQDGCDNACTYCIVREARGHARSTRADQVARRAHDLIAAGAREIVLSGIDLGSYDSDGIRLPGLLSKLLDVHAHSEVEEPWRIRIGSIEPHSISDELIELMSHSEGRICSHLHIPVQSGSASVLGRMGRRYSPESYIDLVERIRFAIPKISITTDVIVGFPAEDDKDFLDTMQLCEACGFSKMHVFPYSLRPGTPAAEMKGQVDPVTKRQRAERLRKLGADLRERDFMSRASDVEQAIVEADSLLTESYHRVANDTDANIGEMLPCVMGQARNVG